MTVRKVAVARRKIRKHTDWADWVARPKLHRPKRLSRSEIESLSAEDVALYNRERRIFANDVVFETPYMAEARLQLLALLRSNLHLSNAPGFGFALDGLGSFGKSTILYELGREYERSRRTELGIAFNEPVETDAGGIWLPVAYGSLTGDTTERGVLSSLAGFYDVPQPRNRRNNSERMEALVDIMDACGTELLMIDDFHHLKVTSAHYAATSNFIKSLASLSNVTICVAGVELIAGGLFDEGTSLKRTPTAGRLSCVEVRPFDINDEEGRVGWRAVVEAFDSTVILADHSPGDLLKLQNYLWDRTGGVVGSLARLIRIGIDLAIENEIESLPRELIDQVKLDEAAEAARRRRKSNVRQATAAKSTKAKPKRKAPGTSLVRDGVGLE